MDHLLGNIWCFKVLESILPLGCLCNRLWTNSRDTTVRKGTQQGGCIGGDFALGKEAALLNSFYSCSALFFQQKLKYRPVTEFIQMVIIPKGRLASLNWIRPAIRGWVRNSFPATQETQPDKQLSPWNAPGMRGAQVLLAPPWDAFNLWTIPMYQGHALTHGPLQVEGVSLCSSQLELLLWSWERLDEMN